MIYTIRSCNDSSIDELEQQCDELVQEGERLQSALHALQGERLGEALRRAASEGYAYLVRALLNAGAGEFARDPLGHERAHVCRILRQ